MVIPEKDKGVKSFRIPRLVLSSILVFCVALVFVLGILIYDYSKILAEVHANKHLNLENRQLREQIQLFQMKLNSLTDDIQRIETFERKLRIISGLEDLRKWTAPVDEKEIEDEVSGQSSAIRRRSPQSEGDFSYYLYKMENPHEQSEFVSLKDLYEQKLTSLFGLQLGHQITKTWTEMGKQTLALAERFALFDYRYDLLNDFVTELEVRVHELDQYLLDKESLLRSTPTILPARGWITSYYGPRKSPYSGRLRMHEGLDVGARTGTPIVAPADGIVTFSGKRMGFGNLIQIDHGYGIETLYAHAHRLTAQKGDFIRRGQEIATVGSTGYSTGPHLHYEVWINGTPVDPLFFILD